MVFGLDCQVINQKDANYQRSLPEVSVSNFPGKSNKLSLLNSLCQADRDSGNFAKPLHGQ